MVREALEKAGRQDLIGFDKKCLIKPYPPKASELTGGKGASRGAGGRSDNGGTSRGGGAGRCGNGRSTSRGGGKGRSTRNGKDSSSKQ